MDIDAVEMHGAAGDATQLMKALSNETRLLILCQLIDGELSVGRLSEILTLRQTTVSQQLSLLRRDGLVSGRRDGHSVYYSIANPGVGRIIQVLYEMYCPKPG
ncbi:MAG: winged helix-turn-helix transcriptional regulator [Rhodospirillaceae bacterium]|jgi:ArsR family transcriptional regulator, virulence genes transcriptional regulator|nr:winged helix-turn-helix transcriptional regulator [Rhodospirillaceae bacterium]